MRYVRDGEGSWEVAFARPGPRLGRAVRLYRGFASTAWKSLSCREYPDIMASMLVLLGGRTTVSGRTFDAGSPPDAEPRCMVAGPHTHTMVIEAGEWLHGLRIDLPPWSLFGILGEPMHTLANRVTDLSELKSETASGLATQLRLGLRRATGWADRFATLDRVLDARLRSGRPAVPYVLNEWREIGRRAGRTSIAALAADAGVCPRHLQAMFREQIGLPAKTCAMAVRIRYALRLLSLGRSVGDVAMECDFYDQAHFSRVVKSMTGFPPSVYRPGGELHGHAVSARFS